MLALNFSDIGTSGAIAIIIIAFVVFGLLKGLVRMTFALIALGAGILAGLWGVTKGGSIAGLLVSNPDPWMSGAVAVILGLAVFFVARALFGVLLKPVAVKDGKKKNAGPAGAIVGLLMGAAFAWFVLAGFRYVGTLAELNWIKDSIADKTKVQKLAQPFFVKIKRAIDSSVPGKIHEKYDFLNDKAKANLAKLSVVVDNKLAVATAAQNKEVREAVFQNEINTMLKEQSTDLKAYIEEGQFAHLLQAAPIKTTCGKTEANAALAAIDVEKALGLIEEPPPKKKSDKKAKEKK